MNKLSSVLTLSAALNITSSCASHEVATSPDLEKDHATNMFVIETEPLLIAFQEQTNEEITAVLAPLPDQSDISPRTLCNELHAAGLFTKTILRDYLVVADRETHVPLDSEFGSELTLHCYSILSTHDEWFDGSNIMQHWPANPDGAYAAYRDSKPPFGVIESCTRGTQNSSSTASWLQDGEFDMIEMPGEQHKYMELLNRIQEALDTQKLGPALTNPDTEDNKFILNGVGNMF